MNNRIIFHVDVNAFYATVEEIDNPQFQGYPIAVAPQRQQAIITTCNYLARSFGVKSAMSVQEAKRLCPQLIITGLHFERYQEVSDAFIRVCESFCEVVEVASIDECYLDMTHHLQLSERPLDAAMKLQKLIFQECQLHVSIGIASNKFLAKVASDLRKPHGLSIIRDNEVKSKLWPLPLPSIVGVGKKTYEILSQFHIHTVRDLMESDTTILAAIPFNVSHLIDKFNGVDDSPLKLNREHKSIGQSRSIGYDCDDEKTLALILHECVTELITRAELEKILFKHIVVGIKDDAYESKSKSYMFETPTRSYNVIFEHVHVLFDHLFVNSVRHISVSCSKIVDEHDHVVQLALFP